MRDQPWIVVRIGHSDYGIVSLQNGKSMRVADKLHWPEDRDTSLWHTIPVHLFREHG